MKDPVLCVVILFFRIEKNPQNTITELQMGLLRVKKRSYKTPSRLSYRLDCWYFCVKSLLSLTVRFMLPWPGYQPKHSWVCEHRVWWMCYCAGVLQDCWWGAVTKSFLTGTLVRLCLLWMFKNKTTSLKGNIS